MADQLDDVILTQMHIDQCVVHRRAFRSYPQYRSPSDVYVKKISQNYASGRFGETTSLQVPSFLRVMGGSTAHHAQKRRFVKKVTPCPRTLRKSYTPDQRFTTEPRHTDVGIKVQKYWYQGSYSARPKSREWGDIWPNGPPAIVRLSDTVLCVYRLQTYQFG